MRHQVTFYFDHIPGMLTSAVYPFVASAHVHPPSDGWKRYRVTVEFDDGAHDVESTVLDVEKSDRVAMTVDGSARYEFPNK